MNALQKLLKYKRQNLLSLFFTAGFPKLDDTVSIIKAAESKGIDFLEVGMPYSDPLADGPVIQQSSMAAIKNGMTIPLLMKQLKKIQVDANIPLLLMGYLNPVIQYGVERFLDDAAERGISGLILPDLPLTEYQRAYQPLFEERQISPVFLITPQTSDERARLMDSHSNAFIYVVSTAATTGKQKIFGPEQEAYFDRICSLNLKNPLIAGFGISNAENLQKAWKHFSGGICGSAFLKKLALHDTVESALDDLLAELLMVD